MIYALIIISHERNLTPLLLTVWELFICFIKFTRSKSMRAKFVLSWPDIFSFSTLNTSITRSPCSINSFFILKNISCGYIWFFYSFSCRLNFMTATSNPKSTTFKILAYFFCLYNASFNSLYVKQMAVIWLCAQKLRNVSPSQIEKKKFALF